MIRVFLTIVLPLLLPTALYLLWVTTFGAPQDGGAVAWTALPWVWLAGAGAVLLAVVLVCRDCRLSGRRRRAFMCRRAM